MIKNNPLAGLMLKIGSYNIKAGAVVRYDMSVIASDITSFGLDVVGLQEIDMKTTRSGGIDTIKLLSEATGYQYYKFTRAIDYRGGQYGTAILSRHPIISSETIQLDAGNKEGRSIGHAIISVDGINIDFCNTHLSYESADLRAGQFKQLAGLLKKHNVFILTGDFNTAIASEFSLIENSFLVNMNTYPTFTPSGEGIDNIVLSFGWTVTAAGMGPAGHSDHNMLWAEIKHT
jgi:endonuclease/exonuclease/phosphatase family metal-dependent hydrolase